MQYSFLIPVLPLLAFCINIFFGKKLKNKSAYISISAISISFFLSLLIFIRMLFITTPVEYKIEWIRIGNFNFELGMLIDGLTSVMLLVVTIVSLLVQVYSIGYMHNDTRYSRYYAYMSLFTFAMLLLVLANNFLEIFISWELVGLCSYLLIGFWFEKKSASDAGKKAFITTKIGDVGFFIGILMLFTCTGTFNFVEISKAISGGLITGTTLTIIAVLVFCGAIGKSAQFPLHVWLPDAMEGPTPVSALIHAATMVAAGVYLVARSYFLFDKSPEALLVVAYIGTFTAFFAATIALVANDIKRVLAYSTISQLGYMIMGLGVGGYSAGMFHLTTHAFFKALLFLCAGSVIHGTGIQDIREMGGLSKKMKITFITFLVAALSISGVPPFSGFYSKDEILSVAFMEGHIWIYLIGTFTAFLTAFYMFRLFFLTFTGETRSKLHPHESPSNMTIPLIILAIFSVVSGFLLTRGHIFLKLVNFPGREFIGEESSHFVMFTSVVVGLLGIFLAWVIYYKKLISAEKIANSVPLLYKILINKYYVDEIYDKIIVQPVMSVAGGFAKFDSKVIDGAVNGSGIITILISKLHDLFDRIVVDGSVNGVGWVTIKSGNVLKLIQTGFIQNYMLIVVGGLVVLVVLKILF
ncbi:MAG: NADH-quinone oxidoreductase subunit L [Candidatus Firestonebacteria bacterium]